MRRLDVRDETPDRFRGSCRLHPGEVWEDPVRGHRVTVCDASDRAAIERLAGNRRFSLVLADPPYNFTVGGRSSSALSQVDIDSYIAFSRGWVDAAVAVMERNASLYVFLGADQNRGFQPLADFILMMREFTELSSRSLITLRNQRGYGTARNWMSVRQELLYYTMGSPPFTVAYTAIPRLVKGYYKVVGGRRTDNDGRSRSPNIRAGNVWVDIQQVFYRSRENVPGAYAQKPIAAIERILQSSTRTGDHVLDCFAHSGTTLIAAERTGRICCTSDRDPIFAELTIRRLERFRNTGHVGWQWESPFPEITQGD